VSQAFSCCENWPSLSITSISGGSQAETPAPDSLIAVSVNRCY
jgi:hypothetical protein